MTFLSGIPRCLATIVLLLALRGVGIAQLEMMVIAVPHSSNFAVRVPSRFGYNDQLEASTTLGWGNIGDAVPGTGNDLDGPSLAKNPHQTFRVRITAR